MSWGDRRSPLPALRPRTTPTAWPLAPARAVRGHRRRADRGDLPGPGRHAGDPQCARLRGSRDLGGRSLELPDRLRRPAATSGVVTPGRGGPARRGGMVPGRRSAPVPIVGNRRGCLWWRGRRVDQRSAQMLAMGRSNSRRPRVCWLGLVGRTAPRPGNEPRDGHASRPALGFVPASCWSVVSGQLHCRTHGTLRPPTPGRDPC